MTSRIQNSDRCPLCWNAYGGKSKLLGTQGPLAFFECEVCGHFGAATNLIHSFGTLGAEERLSSVERAKVIHTVRKNDRGPGEQVFILTNDDLQNVLRTARIPSPAEQAANMIRYIGDAVLREGKALSKPSLHFFADVGAVSPERAGSILLELIRQDILVGSVGMPRLLLMIDNAEISQRELSAEGLDLTLAGWERYEKEKRGQFAGSYGFVALKFGDEILDPLISNTIKPGLKAELGYDVVDMRDAARTGLIDNVMREKIRDAAFVLVDLTHDNYGAYWEAGYAEGLGKPVLYICEKSKFSAAGTHFDTNHMTTILWDGERPIECLDAIVATLRRSIPELLYETRLARRG